MQFIQRKKILKIRLKMFSKKILNTSKFIKTQEFNRLSKIKFNGTMVETSKKFATKNQVEIALDLEHENRDKTKRIQTFDLSYFIGN